MRIEFPQVGSENVRIALTTRFGGTSEGAYDSANLALHVGDDPDRVEQNRHTLASKIGVSPVWLEQTHGNEIATIDAIPEQAVAADASMTEKKAMALAIMTADCLPIMLWSSDGRQVAAIHAGWRGLANGIIQKSVQQFSKGAELNAYVGPAIGPCHYEVDEAVRENFTDTSAFSNGRKGHFWFDLAQEASRQLSELGLTNIVASNICTSCDERFYSYRQSPETGRFATLIWRV